MVAPVIVIAIARAWTRTRAWPLVWPRIGCSLKSREIAIPLLRRCEAEPIGTVWLVFGVVGVPISRLTAPISTVPRLPGEATPD
jgi:hypothetical protein